MTSTKDGAPALRDVETAQHSKAAEDPARGPAKPHGEKLGAAGDASATAAEASREAAPGDSPKRQGDALAHAVDVAAKG